MTMLKYINGPRTSVGYLPWSTVHAGDVIVIGGLPMVADLDDPMGTGMSLVQMSLYCDGGVYQGPFDAAYPVGTRVLWDTAKAQFTTVPAATAYNFGTIVAGPTGLASDGGPTGAAGLGFVLHNPEAVITDGTVGEPWAVVFTIAKGLSANICLVTMQVNDAFGTPIAAPTNLNWTLSDAASGAGLTATTASGAVAAGLAGIDLAVQVAKKATQSQTNATGLYILSITDTAKTGFYVTATIPGLAMQVSRQLVAGDYD